MQDNKMRIKRLTPLFFRRQMRHLLHFMNISDSFMKKIYKQLNPNTNLITLAIIGGIELVLYSDLVKHDL